MHIKQFTITPPDGIDCSFGIVQGEDGHEVPRVLVASFSGVYPEGSRGNSHGHYIAYSTMHALAVVEPWCLILDFRQLEYCWGNTLLLVFDHVSRFMDDENDPTTRFPIVVVTSDKCRDAFLSLVTRTGDGAPKWHLSEHIFRITEDPIRVVCTADFIRATEELGLNGFRFEQMRAG